MAKVTETVMEHKIPNGATSPATPHETRAQKGAEARLDKGPAPIYRGTQPSRNPDELSMKRPR